MNRTNWLNWAIALGSVLMMLMTGEFLGLGKLVLLHQASAALVEGLALWGAIVSILISAALGGLLFLVWRVREMSG